MTVPDEVVFDTEPLLAHADDEPGSAAVDAYLEAVAADDASGYASCVTFCEVRYGLARQYDRRTADQYIDWLQKIGVRSVDVEEVWEGASEFVLRYNPALGDSFALATAEHLDATLLVGGDDDFDEVSDVPLRRFRDGSA